MNFPPISGWRSPSRIGAVLLIAANWLLFGQPAEGQNITDTFNYTVNTSIGNYSGWTVPTGSAVVTTQYVKSATRSLRMVGGQGTEVRRALGGAGSANVLYVDFWIRPVVYENWFETAIFLDGSVIGFIKDGPEGKIYVSDGATTGGAENWVDTGYRFWMNRDGVTASEWMRITIRQDAVNGSWDIYVDGKMFVSNLAFKDRGVLPGYLVMFGGTLPADVYVDDLKIWTSNPVFTDADLDGMEDAFENTNSMDSANDDRELASVQDPNISRIQYYLNETHTWFTGQWAQETTDTDSDGIPDSWELFFGLDPNNSADAPEDRDGDRVSNLQEYQQGTSPAGTYVFKDLGGIMANEASWGHFFQPVDINNLGEVIGSYPQTSSIYRYVKWSPSAGVSTVFINTETVQPRGLLAINDLSQVVGYYKPLTPDNAPMFWWNGTTLNAVDLPVSFNQVTTLASLGTVNFPPDSNEDLWVWYDNLQPPTFDQNSHEYVYTFDLQYNFFYTESGSSYAVNLNRTDWLSYTSNFLELTNAGSLMGTYSSDGGYTEAPEPFVAFDSEFEASRIASSGVYLYQTPVLGATESYTQLAEDDWDGVAYQPVDVNRAGVFLGNARDFEDGLEVDSDVYIETPGPTYETLTPPTGDQFVPLKVNGLGHALLKIENSLPSEFGVYRDSTWVPLSSAFPSGVSLVPIGLDDLDRVVGNATGGFGPSLLTEQGIVRLANAAPLGEGWQLHQGSIKAVNDQGVMVGVSPKTGHPGGPQRCFILWRNDDQDGDGIPDDWERQIFEDDPNDDLTSIADVRGEDDFDGDGLSNLEEFWNNGDPATNAETLASDVGLTVFNRLE